MKYYYYKDLRNNRDPGHGILYTSNKNKARPKDRFPYKNLPHQTHLSFHLDSDLEFRDVGWYRVRCYS